MIAIKTIDLTKKYKEKIVVDNLNLNIEENTLFALLGVNGAGKSTTIKMLSTLIKPTDGDIFILGLNVKDNKTKIREIINASPQETAIAPNLTVRENLYFMAGVYNIKNQEEVINNLIKDFKLEEVLNSFTKTLSGGYKRRLSIALALINSPKILFLDEPTLGLDVISRRELWKIIEKLKKTMTIILTTHYMEEAESLADSIGIINKGRLIDVDTKENILKRTVTQNIEEAFLKIVGDE